MILADSHAHLDMPEFDSDRGEVLRRARAAGVRTILCPIDIVSERSRALLLELASADADIKLAAGLHPHQAKDWDASRVASLKELAEAGRILALGEIGLDFHYNFSTPEEQRAAFSAQLALAGELRLPVIVHSRNAGPEIVAAVDAASFARGGILHCFTEDWGFASRMIDRGFWISFSGIVTFPKAQALRDVARRVPPDRLLIETDAPYLAPVPYRGGHSRNEPAYVASTARHLAELRGIAVEDLAALTTANFAAFAASAARR